SSWSGFSTRRRLEREEPVTMLSHDDTETITSAVADAMRIALEPFKGRIAVLEARDQLRSAQIQHLTEKAAALERHEGNMLIDALKGVWQPNVTYKRGDLVVRDGLWIVTAHETKNRPGTNPGDYKLVVKTSAFAS